MYKSILYEIVSFTVRTFLTVIFIMSICSCSPGSGTIMKLPDTTVKGIPDLAVRDVPIFSPSSENPEHPLRKVVDKKTLGSQEIIFDGVLETNYDPAYVFAWYSNNLDSSGWTIVYTRKYDERFKEGMFTAQRNNENLDITISKSTGGDKTVISYLCTKEEK
jgi:hypothetical protein